MATYQIIPTEDGASFNIGVADGNGLRQTMMGFDSMEDAEAWIVQDRRLSGTTETQPVDGLEAPSTIQT